MDEVTCMALSCEGCPFLGHHAECAADEPILVDENEANE